MSNDYYYSGQYAEEQAEAEAQAKEAAHRQGPWHVSEYTDGRDALIYDEDGFEVARVCYQNRDANARLITAAPELYEALDKIIEWYDNHHLRNEPAFQYYHSARAALAKARGER
jgi:hypothetical protein